MKYKILFWLILVSGLALRLYHAWTAPYAYANSDTCTLWLMARHILHGEFPLFFYGQYYLGPLEALTIAFFFKLFSIGIYTLYLGTIFCSGLFMISGYFLGKEVKDKAVGIITMLYLAFPPSYFFWESIAPLGYHVEIPLLGNIIFILSLKIPGTAPGLKKTIIYIFLGLCAGLGVWTHYIILYYLVPSAIYLLINEKWKNLFKNSIPAIISFFLIGLPFWIFTFKYNFATFRFKSISSPPGALMDFFKLLMQHITFIFNIDLYHNVFTSAVIISVTFIYIISILYFIIGSPFNKKYILSLFFAFIVLFYIYFRSKIYAGEGYNYILPIITFTGIAFAYLSRSVCKKNKTIGLFIILLIISFNMMNILSLMSKNRARSDTYRNIIYDKMKFLKNNKIFRFIGHEGYARVSVFFSNEKIIATGFMECRYPPYEDIVEASDRIAFEKCGSDWRPALDNICKSYVLKNELFYNFKPFPYKIKLIKPANWRGFSNSHKYSARYAFDRNFDNFWINESAGKQEPFFIIDFGRQYTICKIEILNGHRYLDNPASCRIETSMDGKNWLDTAHIDSVQALFWAGPRIYWHPRDGRVQWFFKPTKTRFIKLTQYDKDSKKLWNINEIFVYEYLGEEVFKIRDYIKDAKSIVSFLFRNNKNFAYADFWLSAKIRELSKRKIEALVPYNSFLPSRKNMSRDVQLADGKVFVIERGNSDELELIFSEFKLPYKKIIFNKYICYYFDYLPKDYESISSLIWVGIGLVKCNLKDYSNWLYKRGDYEKALEYYPNNFLAYLKYRNLPKTKFFPEIQKNISFANDIKILGYSIRGRKLRPGRVIRIEYFWEVKNEPGSDLSIFVYFMKDGKIVFQNDHKFLHQFPRPLKPLDGERFREVLKLKLPKDISSGSYQIVIGLWNKNTGKRVKIKDPSSKNISKQIMGELVIP